MKIQLQALGYSRFILYPNFEEWYKNEVVVEEQYTTYRQRKIVLQKYREEKAKEEETLGKQLAQKGKLRDDQGKEAELEKVNLALAKVKEESIKIEEQLDELERRYHKDISRWSQEKKKYIETWRREEEKCRGTLAMQVGNEAMKLKTQGKTVFEMWKILEEDANLGEIGNILSLYNKFFDLKITQKETLVEYIERALMIVEKLKNASEKISETLICYKIINGLSQEYSTLSQIVIQIKKEEMKIELLRGKFMVEESRRKQLNPNRGENRDQKGEIANNVLEEKKCETCKKKFTPRRYYNKYCDSCMTEYKKKQQEREKKKDASNNITDKSKDKKKVKKKVKAKSKSSESESSESEEDTESSGCVVFAGTAVDKRNPWYLDSGCTSHITNVRAEIKNEKKTNSQLEGPRGELSKVNVRGEVQFGGEKLRDTLYEKNLVRKLMSLRKLDEEGKVVIFRNRQCEIYKEGVRLEVEGEMIMRGKLDTSNLYAIEAVKKETEAVNTMSYASILKRNLKSSTIEDKKEKMKKVENLMSDTAIVEMGKKLESKAKKEVTETQKKKDLARSDREIRAVKDRKTAPPVCLTPIEDKKKKEERKSTDTVMINIATIKCGKKSETKTGNKATVDKKKEEIAKSDREIRAIKRNKIAPPVCFTPIEDKKREEKVKKTDTIMTDTWITVKPKKKLKKESDLEQANNAVTRAQKKKKDQLEQRRNEVKEMRAVKEIKTAPPVCTPLKDKKKGGVERKETNTSIPDKMRESKKKNTSNEVNEAEKKKKLSSKETVKKVRAVKGIKTAPPVCTSPKDKKMEEVKIKKTNSPIPDPVKTQTIEEWHRRMGHIVGIKKIYEMEEAGFIKIKGERIKKIKCKVCDRQKLKRKRIPKKNNRNTTEVGEVTYSDICGKINVPSIGGKYYTCNYYDDNSGFVYGTNVRKKSEAFEKFKEFRSLVKNQADKNVKKLVTDGGGEYTSTEFNKYSKEKGIIREVTPPDSSMFNGKSERFNQIQFGAVRCMIDEAKLPSEFWGEASIYLIY